MAYTRSVAVSSKKGEHGRRERGEAGNRKKEKQLAPITVFQHFQPSTFSLFPFPPFPLSLYTVPLLRGDWPVDFFSVSQLNLDLPFRMCQIEMCHSL